MKKIALSLALLCAAAFAKEYNYMLASTAQKTFEEPASSYETKQSYDAKTRRLELVSSSELADGLKGKHKEVSYYNKAGEMMKFEAFSYDFAAKKWLKTTEYKADYKNGVLVQESSSFVRGLPQNASKTVTKRLKNASEDVRYELVKGKWKKATLTKTVEDAHGNNELIVFSVWDGKRWQPKSKTQLLYGADGQTRGYENWDYAKGAWQNRERGLVAGDVKGKYEQVRSVFENGAWRYAEMSKHDYDASSGKDVTINLIWNAEQNAWENNYKDVMVVDGADFETAAFLWDKERKEWAQEYASRNIYDKNARLLTQRYDTRDGSEKFVYSYDVRGDNVSVDVYELAGDENGKRWVHKGRSEATFDPKILADDVGHGGSLMSFDMPSEYAVTGYKRFVAADGKFKLAEEQTWEYKKMR